MAGFTESALSKKLDDLNASQQSIQTLSLWLIHHRKHYGAIVKMWSREIQKADENRQLTLMYLANDVIQNSKKKGPEYGKEFGLVLKKAFEYIGGPRCGEKTRKNVGRLLQIWEERGVYEKRQIEEFRKSFDQGVQELSPPPRKKSKSTNSSIRNRERKKSDKEVEVEVDGMKEVHVTLSPQTPVGDPPEPEELIKALLSRDWVADIVIPSSNEEYDDDGDVEEDEPVCKKYSETLDQLQQTMNFFNYKTDDLENSASSDAAIREKIASLPPEVSEVNLLSKLEDKAAAERLSAQVNDAVNLLTEYNTRLANEMDDRRKVTQMLRDFIQAQRDLLAQAENRLEEYTDKLSKIKQVRHEVKSHLRNLPDLTQLPDVTGGLAPLPSAGDLFRLP